MPQTKDLTGDLMRLGRSVRIGNNDLTQAALKSANSGQLSRKMARDYLTGMVYSLLAVVLLGQLGLMIWAISL